MPTTDHARRYLRFVQDEGLREILEILIDDLEDLRAKLREEPVAAGPVPPPDQL